MEVLSVPNKTDKILNEFIDGVKEILGEHLQQIILYGSYARRRL